MRRALASVLALVAAGAFVLVATGARRSSQGKTYKVVLDNAFGLTKGGDVKVGGVRAGKVTGFGLARDHRAIVTFRIDRAGFGSFRTDATCETRPQSLIGEYFIDCQPGQGGRDLKPGGTIPVTHTTSTVGPDLVNDILRLPYRERLRLIIGELGAGVAARGEDLNAAIRRAVPALRETDGLLRVLGDQSATINRLTGDANTVVTALANNKAGVQGFIRYARRTSVASAERRTAIAATFHRLPAFLEQLRPTMVELGRVADRQTPAIRDLAASAPRLEAFLADLPPFSAASKPALLALGKASVTGRAAVTAARPTITYLNRFARPTPELAHNLAIVLRKLDDRGSAIEPDTRAAGQLGTTKKVGYTGLEDLLMYAYNQSVAANSFDRFGHLLRVDAFGGGPCAPYYSLAALKQALKKDPSIKHCLSVLGPTYPGLNAPDPSDLSLVKSGKADLGSGPLARKKVTRRAGARAGGRTGRSRRSSARAPSASSAPGGTAGRGSPAAPGETSSPTPKTPGPVDLPGVLGQLLGPAKPKLPAPPPATSSAPAPDAGDLLNYLLAP